MVRTYNQHQSSIQFGEPEGNLPRRGRRNRFEDVGQSPKTPSTKDSIYGPDDDLFGAGLGGLASSRSDGNLEGGGGGHLSYEMGELTGTLQRLQDGFNPSSFDDYEGGDRLSSYGLGRNFSAPTGTNDFSFKANHDASRSDYGRSISQTDPLSQLRHNSRRKSDGIGIGSHNGYNPSMLADAGGTKVKIRRGGGGNNPPETYHPNSNQDAVMRLAQERAMQESDRRADMEKREWWQRRRGPEENAAPEKEFAPERRMGARRKPHPSQGQSEFPRKDPKAYEEELRAHQEASKRIKEEEARREREEEERLERRVQQQQDKMRREYEEEQERKRSKEQAVIQRQENLARKQQEIREEMERKKAEAEEEKARTRRRKARLAAEAARRRSPGAYGDDDDGSRDRGAGRDARSDSPPIPTMRNKNSNIPGGDGVGDGHAEVVEQLSTMRKELDRKAEEHDAVWNGLVEV